MEIRLLKGPISDELLLSIAALYGEVDQRYSSIEFCRNKFNDNPYGYSLHAFAYDSDKIVGHQSLIPEEATAFGKKVLSAKGEALIVEESYRTKNLVGNLPIGIALPMKLYNFALQNGIQVIYLISDKQVDKIHRACGAKPVTIQHDRYVYTILGFNFIKFWQSFLKNKVGSLNKAIVILLLSLCHFLLGSFWKIFFLLYSKINFCEEKNPDSLLLSNIANDIKIDNAHWSLSVSEQHLNWVIKSGLKVITINNSVDNYITLLHNAVQGYVSVLVNWHIGFKDILSNLEAIIYVIEQTKKQKGAMVILSNITITDDLNCLIKASRLLGFIKWQSKLTISIKSKESRFLNSNYMVCTPYFFDL